VGLLRKGKGMVFVRVGDGEDVGDVGDVGDEEGGGKVGGEDLEGLGFVGWGCEGLVEGDGEVWGLIHFL